MNIQDVVQYLDDRQENHNTKLNILVGWNVLLSILVITFLYKELFT